jgi:hypothetical protein
MGNFLMKSGPRLPERRILCLPQCNVNGPTGAPKPSSEAPKTSSEGPYAFGSTAIIGRTSADRQSRTEERLEGFLDG